MLFFISFKYRFPFDFAEEKKTRVQFSIFVIVLLFILMAVREEIRKYNLEVADNDFRYSRYVKKFLQNSI